MNAAREKVEREGGCRVCGAPPWKCDAAHLWPRSLGATGFDDPDLIVPLCSKLKRGKGCHDAFDAHQLDLLPYLSHEEQSAVVRLAGIERARERLIGKRQSNGRRDPERDVYGPF